MSSSARFLRGTKWAIQLGSRDLRAASVSPPCPTRISEPASFVHQSLECPKVVEGLSGVLRNERLHRGAERRALLLLGRAGLPGLLVDAEQ
mmetsp:Transcript_39788/g.59320  ORF Transcript_39788/g.59320 Transcript_39788/m.59320 type:complete len:91 (+) Transcript_39788:169-441(+)